MRITIVGGGYVGLSSAIVLSQENDVTIFDVSSSRVKQINDRIPPFKDSLIEDYFNHQDLKLKATLEEEIAFMSAEYIIISLPTDYDIKTNTLDTSAIESTIRRITIYNTNAVIIIKSTIPIGYTLSIINKFGIRKILYNPEFIRESNAIYDCLNPSRIIIGTDLNDEQMMCHAYRYLKLIIRSSHLETIPSKIISYNEAEAAKLFSNAYLALRVAFFNELDTYAEVNKLSTINIIESVSLDPRIGNYYNNPSFGYGGYCLPKDTKQLLASFHGISQDLIGSIVKSNCTRISYIAKRSFDLARMHFDKNERDPLLHPKPVIGIFRLTMKSNSDNFRNAAIHDIIISLKTMGAKIIIYEPLLIGNEDYMGDKIVNKLENFKYYCDIIIANRYSTCLDDVKHKVYTRDIFFSD